MIDVPAISRGLDEWAIHYLFGCYAQPIHRDNVGAPVPNGGFEALKDVLGINTVGFLDLVGATFARLEHSVDVRLTRDRADAEWRDVRFQPDGMLERPIVAARTPARFRRAAHCGGTLRCGLSASCRADVVASCTEGSLRVPPQRALLDAGHGDGVRVGFALRERPLPPLPAIVRHLPP